jgi:hypothetical protein
VALDCQGRGDQSWKEQQGKAEVLADAIGSGCYDEDVFRERGGVVGGKKRRERRRLTAAVRLFIAGKSSSGFESTRRRCHDDGDVPACEEAVRDDRRRQAGGGELFRLNFKLITELPLSSFYKLLSNFLKKLKISKNKSCSTFQTLQLCFKKHFQILPPFSNLNLGYI